MLFKAIPSYSSPLCVLLFSAPGFARRAFFSLILSRCPMEGAGRQLSVCARVQVPIRCHLAVARILSLSVDCVRLSWSNTRQQILLFLSQLFCLEVKNLKWNILPFHFTWFLFPVASRNQSPRMRLRKNSLSLSLHVPLCACVISIRISWTGQVRELRARTRTPNRDSSASLIVVFGVHHHHHHHRSSDERVWLIFMIEARTLSATFALGLPVELANSQWAKPTNERGGSFKGHAAVARSLAHWPHISQFDETRGARALLGWHS